MREKTYLITTGFIFTILTVLHGLRLINSWEARIAGWDVPVWFSTVAIVLAGYLALRAFQLSKRSGK